MPEEDATSVGLRDRSGGIFSRDTPRPSQEQTRPTRKTSLTLDTEHLDEARSYGINISAAATEGVAQQVKARRWRRWQDENRAWIASHKAWIEETGVPFAEYRTI
jgi:antitoxin CcdA